MDGKLTFCFSDSRNITVDSADWADGGVVNFYYKDCEKVDVMANTPRGFEMYSEMFSEVSSKTSKKPSLEFTLLRSGDPLPSKVRPSLLMTLMGKGQEGAPKFPTRSLTKKKEVVTELKTYLDKEDQSFSFETQYLPQIFDLLIKAPGFRLPPMKDYKSYDPEVSHFCPYHRQAGHFLTDCMTFKLWLEENLAKGTVILPTEYMKPSE